MDTRFETTSDMCEQISAGKVSIVEVLPETNAQIENFDDAMNAVSVGNFERAVEEAGLRRRSRTSEDSLGCGD